MNLFDILKGKGSLVYTIAPDATLEEAAQEMIRHNVGSLVVCDRDLCEGERLLGILAERDILRYCAIEQCSLREVTVGDAMVKVVITATPADTVESAMGVMTSSRIRHLPVLSEGRLVGLVSIGDLVKNQIEHLAMENHFMKTYITG